MERQIAQKFIVLFTWTWRLCFASLIPFVRTPYILLKYEIFWYCLLYGFWDSVVSFATRYGLGIPGFELRWGRDFPDRSSSAPRPSQLSVQWLPCLFPGGRATADLQPPSCAIVECGYNYTSSLFACLATNGSYLSLDVASGLILASFLISILRVFLIRLKTVTFRNSYWLN